MVQENRNVVFGKIATWFELAGWSVVPRFWDRFYAMHRVEHENLKNWFSETCIIWNGYETDNETCLDWFPSTSLIVFASPDLPRNEAFVSIEFSPVSERISTEQLGILWFVGPTCTASDHQKRTPDNRNSFPRGKRAPCWTPAFPPSTVKPLSRDVCMLSDSWINFKEVWFHDTHALTVYANLPGSQLFTTDWAGRAIDEKTTHRFTTTIHQILR